MNIQVLLWALIGLAVLAVILLTALLLRRPDTALADLRARVEDALREEQRAGRTELRQQLDSAAATQEQRMSGFNRNLVDLGARTDRKLDLLREALGEDARRSRQESAESQQRFTETLSQQLSELIQRNHQGIAEMRATLESRLKELQADNAAKLEQMRLTVDEKLHATLETRLTESFGNVTQMLTQVHQGLGDMNKLAADVGGLQRALTNVRARGIFGEVQLAGLLEQVFAPDQYATNVATIPGSSERVEFAIRLPGTADDGVVWLPVDAKFPREDYERLLDAQEHNDPEAARLAGVALERSVREEARRIRGKYVAVPHTTDFAILFLPTESLYAEVLRRPGLFEAMQRDLRITIAGPTTLLALLTSLQVGFRTVAIEKRSDEVWRVLGAAKTEFGKFGEILDSIKSKLDQASSQIEKTGVRTRAIERKLRDVESLPADETQRLLGGDGTD
ncbi:MAG: DNA recombination protein RmuC [Xanthomonadaceae bacterium]|jgi:DNA recombination protein RmuC|nr:DNA recombination protein RmuC [Xanthomonadaceae bacterium]